MYQPGNSGQPAGHSSCSHGSFLSLLDNHGRRITYLRLAITDRCNLRCRYCMPEEGIVPTSHRDMLSYEEMHRLVKLLLPMGIVKVRITGGEPFARRDCLEFLSYLRTELQVPQLFVTTNGVETWRYLDGLHQIGISGINLSLDTLDRHRFQEITRRDQLENVLHTLHQSVALGIPVKINTVVLDDTSDREIVQLAALARDLPVNVRFIEKMPFSGRNGQPVQAGEDLATRLQRIFPLLQERVSQTVTTARLFTLPGYQGSIGLIAGHSRHFCASCNKIRITAHGMLKACLYDNGVLDLRAMLRAGAENQAIEQAIRASLDRRHLDGHATEQFCQRQEQPSMASIGG